MARLRSGPWAVAGAGLAETAAVSTPHAGSDLSDLFQHVPWHLLPSFGHRRQSLVYLDPNYLDLDRSKWILVQKAGLTRVESARAASQKGRPVRQPEAARGDEPAEKAQYRNTSPQASGAAQPARPLASRHRRGLKGCPRQGTATRAPTMMAGPVLPSRQRQYFKKTADGRGTMCASHRNYRAAAARRASARSHALSIRPASSPARWSVGPWAPPPTTPRSLTQPTGELSRAAPKPAATAARQSVL